VDGQLVAWDPLFREFSLQPIDVAVVQEAASIRATRGLTTPDALIVASGVVAGVQILVCNDARWKGISDTRLEVVVLSDHVPL
jgi:predicted nucleic acid-binding protein